MSIIASWAPNTDNAWWPQMHTVDDRIFVAYGNVDCHLAELAWANNQLTAMREADLGSGVRGLQWRSPYILTGWREREDLGRDIVERVELDAREAWTFRVVEGPSGDVGGNITVARDGHVVEWRAAPYFRLRVDGQIVAGQTGGAVGTADGYVCFAETNDNLRINRRAPDGFQTQSFPCLAPLHQAVCGPDGYVAYGGYGPVVGIAPAGTQLDLTATPWRFEGPMQLWRGGDGRVWFASVTSHGEVGDLYILLRPWGEKACVVVRRGAVSASVIEVGGVWVVASCTDVGRGTVDVIPTNTPRELVSDGGSVPLPPPPPPTELPAAALRVPWRRPIWVVPYQSYNSVRYGDTTDFVGNAVLVIREDRSQTTEQVQAEGQRVGRLGKPMIIQPEVYTPAIASLVVGLYIHASDVPTLNVEVARIEALVASGELPDLPVVVYLDQAEWPSTPPASLDPDQHWLSPQVYREPGEPLAGFEQRIAATLTRLAAWGFRLMPTVQAYDRNGLGTVEEALSTMRMVKAWDADEVFDFIGIMPFSDMRRGQLAGRVIGGMEVYPPLREMVRTLALLNPEDRPNRYSYWTPRAEDISTVLLNILGQDRELVSLSEEQKQYLRELVVGADPDPGPVPPTPGQPPPVNLQTAVIHRGPSDISTWVASSVITAAHCQHGQLCTEHTQAGRWPIVPFFGDPTAPIEGNQWTFAYINGQWHGGANEWLRPGQQCKAVEAAAIGHDAFGSEPLHSWVPRTGEWFAVMVSTPARDYPNMHTTRERSNVALLRWND